MSSTDEFGNFLFLCVYASVFVFVYICFLRQTLMTLSVRCLGC